jgi:hypothetical protein
MWLAASIVWSCPILWAQSKPAVIDIADGPIPVRVLVQSPVDADTDLQIICLFQSSPANTLHGSLAEANEKLKGLLDRVRSPKLFRGGARRDSLADAAEEQSGREEAAHRRIGRFADILPAADAVGG